MPTMKAFLVTEAEENTGGVIFAERAIDARKIGASEWNDGELGGMHVHRVAEFDQFYGKGVPARLLVERGWWFECCGCGMTIRDDTLEEAGLVVGGVTGTECSRIYCHAECEAKARAREVREKDAGRAFLDKLRDIVRCRFGDVTFVEGPFREHAYVTEQNGILNVGQGVVSFVFPGMTHGEASLRYDWGYGQALGPVLPEYSVPRGDLEAFEAWAAEAQRP